MTVRPTSTRLFQLRQELHNLHQRCRHPPIEQRPFLCKLRCCTPLRTQVGLLFSLLNHHRVFLRTSMSHNIQHRRVWDPQIFISLISIKGILGAFQSCCSWHTPQNLLPTKWDQQLHAYSHRKRFQDLEYSSSLLECIHTILCFQYVHGLPNLIERVSDVLYKHSSPTDTPPGHMQPVSCRMSDSMWTITERNGTNWDRGRGLQRRPNTLSSLHNSPTRCSGHHLLHSVVYRVIGHSLGYVAELRVQGLNPSHSMRPQVRCCI